MRALRIPDLIAYGGNVAEYPENSLPALRSALNLGAEFLHVDVQLSADHRPVLLRDATLARTAGLNRDALEMSASELAEVAVNEDARFMGRYTDVGIPTLAQAVSLVAGHPAATVFIELQSASLNKFGGDIVVRKVCELLKPAARQCVLVSSDLAALHRVRQLFAYRIGWSISEYSSLAALKCEALAPDFVFCSYELASTGGGKFWRGPWRWAITHVETRTQALDVAAREARLVATAHFRTLLREFKRMKDRE